MEQQNCLEDIRQSKNPLQRGTNLQGGVKIAEETFREFGEVSTNRRKKREDAEARNDFWSIEGDFICRHPVEPQVQLYVPKEESFPIPLKCIDVTSTTRTNLDVLKECCIDEYWNVDVDRAVSDSWTEFMNFTLLDEKRPNGCVWSGRRLPKIQATTRPDYLWPGTRMSKAAQRKKRKADQRRGN